ncbi:MAG: hypothetical protein V4502_00535 [Pseudomonadota bacterium]
MTARFLITAAAISLAGAAVAEPAKNDSPPPPHARPAVVLASADQAQPPAPQSGQQATTPIKHRVSRVTSCRCGDPQVDPEQQDQ